MNAESRTGVVSALAALLFIVPFVLMFPQKANAIPAFSRQYGTSCTTCHSDFPKLNDFGKAFKDAGFKFPKDDETFLKIQPTMLGAPAQKELWPKTVWPGTIPGLPPIGLRYNQFFQVVGANRGNLARPPGGVIPRTDFESGLFSIFTAGNFGGGIAFWVDDDISVAGANANGALGDAYLRFVDLGRFAKLPKDSLTLRAGQFELDLPFTQARTYNLSGYDIYGETNFGVAPQQFVNNNFSLADAAQGVEISGGHSYGGYHYSLAVVNQNTSGGNATIAPNVSSATGVGFVSDSNFKDLYGRLAYRFNLERDPASRNGVQAAGPMGPRDHTSLRLGTFYFYGRSVQRVTDTVGVAVTGTAREPFYRVGGDFDFHYRLFNLYGLYAFGHDHNLVPVDATGTPVSFAPDATTGIVVPSSPVDHFDRGKAATFDGGFIQADYLALPWMMTIMRWDSVNSTADRINGGPYRSTRNRFTPGVQFLIRANIKASFEYQYQPQFVFASATGRAVPFRTNVAVTGLEFVY